MLKDVHRQKHDISTAEFKEYFESLNITDDEFIADNEVKLLLDKYARDELSVMFSELDVSITQDEVKYAINQLHNGKSPGNDLILNEFLIAGKDILTPYITMLFDKILQSGYYPTSWTEGIIVPIHKSGDINDSENYRGITLLSIFGKLFTRILNNRLTSWGEHYGVYIEAQAGFRKNHSTRDHIFLLHNIIDLIFSKNVRSKLYCTFVDFRKAFDYIIRDNLWYKLLNLGIRGKMFCIIKNMYDKVKSRVQNNIELSDCFDCHRGVRQGEILSPFLFSMYVNDLEDTLFLHGADCVNIETLKLFLLMYADDIVIFAESPEGMQNNLNILEMYCKKWNLTVNTNKTKVMIFQKRGRISQQYKWYYNGVELEVVSKAYSYLGIVFTPNGNFTKAQTKLAEQASKAMFSLFKYISKFSNLSVAILLELFDKLILPILCYSCEVWGFNKAKDIERVHLKFCKYILKMKTSTLNEIVYGEVGRYPLFIERYKRIVKYWLHITQTNECKYVKMIYNIMYQKSIVNMNTVNWVTNVRDLLNTSGFGEVWLNQHVGNPDLFLKIFTIRLQDMYKQNWSTKLSNSSSARSYFIFKDMFLYSDYLDTIKFERWRIAFTRLRTNNHNLAIETGRWTQQPIENRRCKMCNVLEDEFHFLFECSLYNGLRESLLPRMYYLRPNMLKFKEIMSTSNPKLLNKLSKFTYLAFNIRKEHVRRELLQ